jgi:hypothetical protein
LEAKATPHSDTDKAAIIAKATGRFKFIITRCPHRVEKKKEKRKANN